MRFERLCVLILFGVPAVCLAASKDIEELQRDLGLLQEQVRALQVSQGEQFTKLGVLVQQAIDGANKANTTVAVIEDNIRRSVNEQEQKIVTPVVSLGTRVDQMSSDFRTLQQAVSDLAAQMSKMQVQLTDLGNAVKAMSAPPAPPPPPTGASDVTGASGSPSMSASDLYSNARRDDDAGKYDLALQEYSDYLKWYGNTALAPNAQFYIAHIHYAQGDYNRAADEFDMVLEKYPDNNKTADALYLKGMALVKEQRRTDGAQEFRELIKRFPNDDNSKKACTELRNMGLSCGTARAATAPPKAASKKKE
jgi:tol-pal system protein YbgF